MCLQCDRGHDATCHSQSRYVQALVALLRRPVPTAEMPADDTEREANPWWKLRKWVLRISFRLIQRYGDPKIIRTDSSKPFAQLFLEEFSQDYLKVCIPQNDASAHVSWTP